MVHVCRLKHLMLGKPGHSGHEVYPEAVYCPTPDLRDAKQVIYKKNKHGNPKYSLMEVAFGELFDLCSAPNLSAPQQLVVNAHNKITGLVVNHQCYVAKAKESLDASFYSLKHPEIKPHYTKKTVEAAEEINIYFLDKLPHGFFERLLQAEKKGELSIDYISLARVLATAYTLEEDDLHKGNLGFYIVEKEGKPQVVFFKIDHDLLFADSIMSFHQFRAGHWFNGAHAFDFSAEDLLNFPFILSSNAYWPTKVNYVAPFWSNKVYRLASERAAFASLAAEPLFKKAKWMAFYKHILLPEALIKSALQHKIDARQAVNRAQITLITQAMVARQARLRATLYSIPEFRQFVVNVSDEEKNSLLDEINRQAAPVVSDLDKVMESVQHAFFVSELFCGAQTKEYRFEEGDTPIHTAIKLGDYRYVDTLETFGHLINTKNKAGKTPLDVAVEMVAKAEKNPKDIRKDVRFIIKHLINNGAKQSPAFKRFNAEEHIESYRFKTPHAGRAMRAKTYQEFKKVLRDIGEDSSLCLKFKKNFAIDCIALFIKSNKGNASLRPILLKLRKEINQGGEKAAPESACLQYVRQLRSKLWIIRKIRGTFGWTTTQGEINTLIDNQLELLPSKNTKCCFFGDSEEDEFVEEEGLDLEPPKLG